MPAQVASSVLLIDVKPGEMVSISPGVSIQVLKKSGQFARLRITAPRDVAIRKIVADAVATMKI